MTDSTPLIAYFTPTVSSPTISGIRSSASSICGSKSCCVNGSSVGLSADSSIDGISSASSVIGRWAYEPISRPVPSWRSYMFVSTSRTIGYSIMPVVFANRGTGPMSIIWWTIGVSGIEAPAIRAMRGLQAPHAITIRSASKSPRVVLTRVARPCSTSIPSTSVLAWTFIPASIARSRMIVPARSESTTPAPGVKNPPMISDSLMYGTLSLICCGVRSSTGSMPQDLAETTLLVSSCIRSSLRAISIPPLSTNTSRSLY